MGSFHKKSTKDCTFIIQIFLKILGLSYFSNWIHCTLPYTLSLSTLQSDIILCVFLGFLSFPLRFQICLVLRHSALKRLHSALPYLTLTYHVISRKMQIEKFCGELQTCRVSTLKKVYWLKNSIIQIILDIRFIKNKNILS